MKNFMLIALNLSIVVFFVAGIMAFVNYSFGTNIGFQGAEVPGDPAIGILSFVIAAFCYGVNYLVTREKA
jgi:drug/metabolite transporter (DMT)-like permease